MEKDQKGRAYGANNVNKKISMQEIFCFNGFLPLHVKKM